MRLCIVVLISFAGLCFGTACNSIATQAGNSSSLTDLTVTAGHDLTGLWDDSGREIEITQDGDKVTANYVEPYVCDHRDGTGDTSETHLDFEATLDGDELVGETNVCNWGEGNELGVGLALAPVAFTLSEDGQVLTGSWYSKYDGVDVPLVITRIPE